MGGITPSGSTEKLCLMSVGVWTVFLESSSSTATPKDTSAPSIAEKAIFMNQTGRIGITGSAPSEPLPVVKTTEGLI